MTRKLIQLGVCVLLAGCAPAGTRQQSLFSSGSARPEATQQQLAQQQQSASPAAASTSAFSLGNMLKFVGFQKNADGPAPPNQPAAPAVLPPEVAQLGGLINDVAGRAAELNVEDDAETTRQKAIGILDVLQQWDGQVAQTQASGGLNAGTSQALNSFVGQIRAGAQRLVQYVPTPENITAVKQTASNLYAAGQTMGGVMQQVSGMRQAFANEASSALPSR